MRSNSRSRRKLAYLTPFFYPNNSIKVGDPVITPRRHFTASIDKVAGKLVAGSLYYPKTYSRIPAESYGLSRFNHLGIPLIGNKSWKPIQTNNSVDIHPNELWSGTVSKHPSSLRIIVDTTPLPPPPYALRPTPIRATEARGASTLPMSGSVSISESPAGSQNWTTISPNSSAYFLCASRSQIDYQPNPETDLTTEPESPPLAREKSDPLDEPARKKRRGRPAAIPTHSELMTDLRHQLTLHHYKMSTDEWDCILNTTIKILRNPKLIARFTRNFSNLLSRFINILVENQKRALDIRVDCLTNILKTSGANAAFRIIETELTALKGNPMRPLNQFELSLNKRVEILSFHSGDKTLTAYDTIDFSPIYAYNQKFKNQENQINKNDLFCICKDHYRNNAIALFITKGIELLTQYNSIFGECLPKYSVIYLFRDPSWDNKLFQLYTAIMTPDNIARLMPSQAKLVIDCFVVAPPRNSISTAIELFNQLNESPPSERNASTKLIKSLSQIAKKNQWNTLIAALIRLKDS